MAEPCVAGGRGEGGLFGQFANHGEAVALSPFAKQLFQQTRLDFSFQLPIVWAHIHPLASVEKPFSIAHEHTLRAKPCLRFFAVASYVQTYRPESQSTQ